MTPATLSPTHLLAGDGHDRKGWARHVPGVAQPDSPPGRWRPWREGL